MSTLRAEVFWAVNKELQQHREGSTSSPRWGDTAGCMRGHSTLTDHVTEQRGQGVLPGLRESPLLTLSSGNEWFNTIL